MEGPDSALPQKLDHSLRADRRLERKERELPRAFAWASVHTALSVGKVVCAFCELPCQRVGVLRGGVAGTERGTGWAVELAFQKGLHPHTVRAVVDDLTITDLTRLGVVADSL